MGSSYKLPLPWIKCHAEQLLLYYILWTVSQMNFTSLKLVGSYNGSQRHRSNRSNLIQMSWKNQRLSEENKTLPFPLFLFFLPHFSTKLSERRYLVPLPFSFIIHFSTAPLPQTANQHPLPLPWGNNLLIYQVIQLWGMIRPQPFIFLVIYRLNYSPHDKDFISSYDQRVWFL